MWRSIVGVVLACGVASANPPSVTDALWVARTWDAAARRHDATAVAKLTHLPLSMTRGATVQITSRSELDELVRRYPEYSIRDPWLVGKADQHSRRVGYSTIAGELTLFIELTVTDDGAVTEVVTQHTGGGR